MNDQNIINRLQQLSDQNGGTLTPDKVVEDSKDEASPLHRYFDWGDTDAAIKWRRKQARELIRSIRVEVHEQPRPPVRSVRTEVHEQQVRIKAIGYVQDPDKPASSQGYVPTASLRLDRDRAMRVLEAELVRAEAAMSRAKGVAAALGLEDEVDAVIARIRGMKSAA